MTRLIAFVGLLAAGIVAIALVTPAPRPAYDPYQGQRAQLVYQAQRDSQARAQALEPFDRLVGASIRIALAALPLAVLGVALDAYRLRRRLVVADGAGRLPMPRRVVESNPRPAIAALAAFHATEYQRATAPPSRALATPAPVSVPTLITSDQVEPLPPAIDLSALVQDWRPSLDAILLGVGPGGKRITVPARDLCHVALAGATGGGKSNIMRLVVSQLQSAGAKVVLADPHYAPLDAESGDDWRAIQRRLHLAPAVQASEIDSLLAWLATDELPQRLERRRNGQPAGPPLFLAIDELPAIIADVRAAPAHMARLLREGRKCGIFVVGAAQDWLAKTLGGAGAIRDCYRTAYYVGGDQTSARVLLDVTGHVDETQLGEPGLAFLRSRVTPSAQLVRVPLASNAALATLLPSSTIEWQPSGSQVAADHADLLCMPDGSLNLPGYHVADVAIQSEKTLSAEQQRILALFSGGADVASVVKEVYGVASSAGRAYQERSRDVQQTLRTMLVQNT